MLSATISILAILLTIFFIVGIHEFGHFIAARLLGIKVLCFSIGFGKALARWHDKKGTEYIFAAIPLGGYVKLLDETEGDVPQQDLAHAFNRQPFYKKFLVIAAGPIFNLIFAFVLYWILFVVGFNTIVPTIGKVFPNSIAAQAGLKPQQEITSIDNTPTLSWMGVVIRLTARTGDTGQMLMTTKDPKTHQTQKHVLELANWRMDNLKPNPLESLGITAYAPDIPTTIAQVLSDSPATRSGLRLGDRIIAVDNKPVKTWDDFLLLLEAHPDATLNFTIERGGKQITLPVTTGHQRSLIFKKYGFLGVAPAFTWPKDFFRKNKYGPVDAIARAWQNTVDFTRLNFMVFGKLLTGKVSLQSLGGPIFIFSSAGSALNQGIVPFISLLAFLSIAIGTVNVLPIPGLDGGHLVFQVIERIMGRPISEKTQTLLLRLGMIFLLLLIAQSIVNDLMRL